MVTDIKSALDIWQAHFNAIFNGDDTNNSANEIIWSSRPKTLVNATPVAPPDREEPPTKPAVMMASMLYFLKQAEMSWLAVCTTFSTTYGLWKACEVIGVLVFSAQYSKSALPQSAAIIMA